MRACKKRSDRSNIRPDALRELYENMEGQQGARRSIVRFLFVFWQDNAKREEKVTKKAPHQHCH
jgi:hypothetical protein